MKTKTSELTGPALDWAVAKCEQKPLVFRGRKWPTDGAATVEYAPWAVHPVVNGSGPFVASLCNSTYSPSTDWAQGGPIIERERMHIDCLRSADHYRAAVWEAWPYATGTKHIHQGPTPLIAAMRCYVASKLGDEVEIPEELA